MDSGLVNSTQSANRRHSIDTTKSKLVNLEQPTNTDESESAEILKSIEKYELELSNLEQPIDIHDPEPREKVAETSK